MNTLGAGLAALAFWGFIAAVVIAYYWDNIRKREARHETVRRMVESGQKIDPLVIDRLLGDGERRYDPRDFKVTALWVLPVSAGAAVLGLVLGAAIPEAKAPILGAAALLAVMGAGFWFAAGLVARWERDGREPRFE